MLSSQDARRKSKCAYATNQVGRDSGSPHGRLCLLLVRCLWLLGVPKREALVLAKRGASGLLTLLWLALALAAVLVLCLFHVHLAAVVIGMMAMMLMFRQYQEEMTGSVRPECIVQSFTQKLGKNGPKRFGVYDGLDPRCRCQKARSQKIYDRSTDLLEDDENDLEWGDLGELERI